LLLDTIGHGIDGVVRPRRFSFSSGQTKASYMSTIVIILTILVTALLLMTVALWVGARWVQAGKATLLRSLCAVFLSRFIMLGLFAGSLMLPPILDPGNEDLKLVALLALIPAELLVTCLIIQFCLKCSLSLAIRAWVISWIAVPAFLALLLFVVRPFVAERFIVPSNSMAPIVVGWHHIGTCPKCGGIMFSSVNTPGELGRPDPDRGICTVCMQAGTIQDVSTEVKEADRIVVNKLLTPERWDIIAFRSPTDHDYIYIKRLVGLPGETVFFEDDAIFINDERQTPPGSLAGLKYTRNRRPYQQPAGTRRDPFRLGENEYFVLGDFSEISSDSRHWGPVPRGNIEGVVTLRYWPPSRRHIFR
jgi:signal peptidase I